MSNPTTKRYIVQEGHCVMYNELLHKGERYNYEITDDSKILYRQIDSSNMNVNQFDGTDVEILVLKLALVEYYVDTHSFVNDTHLKLGFEDQHSLRKYILAIHKCGTVRNIKVLLVFLSLSLKYNFFVSFKIRNCSLNCDGRWRAL
jgi:hypothetical protein